MKFLTITKLTDSATLCPPATMRQLLEATLAWADELTKTGTLLERYAIPGGGVVTICEHPSVEDTARTIASTPMGGLMRFEVYPLADSNETKKAYLETFKKAEQF